MKKIILTIISILMATGITRATNNPEFNYFQKGGFLSVDLSTGTTFNENNNMSYGIDIAIGYRFCPQFVLAAGLGGHAYTNTTARIIDGKLRNNQTTSVPVFIRLRSDILDRKISPYVQMDLGYSFVFLYSRDATGKFSYNNEVFKYKLEEMGFDKPDDYEKHFRELYADKTTEVVDELWKDELIRLEQFTNGRREYIPIENVHTQYGKNGLFCNLELGLGWQIGDKLRMNVGVSTGLSQSYYGTCLRTTNNEFLKFGRIDYLPYDDENNKEYVWTVGQPDFMDSFEIDMKIKIGLTF